MGFGIKSHLRGHHLYRYLRDGEAYASAFDLRKPLIRYIGWLGHRNIGDEALFDAFRLLFDNTLITPYYDLSPLSVLAALRSQKLVALGGGTLINDDSYIEQLERAQRAGRRTFTFGTGVGDLAYWSKFKQGERGNPKRWAQVLSKADYVGVRGPRSLQWLQEQGVKNAEIIGDSALSLTLAQRKLAAEPTLGVNLGSHDPTLGGEDMSFDAMVGLVRHAIQSGYRVKYLSMHDIDFEVGRKLEAAVKHERFELPHFTAKVNDSLQDLGECHLVVGQRLHCTVLACALGIPNLSLSYQPKCLDFLESIARSDLSISTTAISAGLLIEKLSWLESQAESLKKDIDLSCDAWRVKQRQEAARLVARLTSR